jgi:hypothetical protein
MRVMTRMKVCAECGSEYRPWAGRQGIASKFCSSACAGQSLRAQALASYPSEAETRAAYHDELLSDEQFGRRHGRSYQWAFTVRRAYGIDALAFDERVQRRRSVMRVSPQAQARERLVRSVWNLSEKGEAQCRNCWRTDRRVHLHHAIPRSMCAEARLNLLNGVPLCTVCHFGWHRRQVTIYRDVFTPEEWAYISSVQLVGQDTQAWLDDRYPEKGDCRGRD